MDASCPDCDTLVESVSGRGDSALYTLHPCGHVVTYDVDRAELVSRGGKRAHDPQPLSPDGKARQAQRDRFRIQRAERLEKIQRRQEAMGRLDPRFDPTQPVPTRIDPRDRSPHAEG